MSGDLMALAAEVTPYMTAAVGAYGGAVLAKVEDSAADATVGLGRRLLHRVFGTRAAGERLPEPLGDLVADPADDDARAALRLKIRKVFAANPELETEVRTMMVDAGVTVSVSGERSIAAQVISGIAATGDNTAISR